MASSLWRVVMNEELEKCGKKRSWPLSKHYPVNSLVWLWSIMENLTQDIPCPDRDSNRVAIELKSEASATIMVSLASHRGGPGSRTGSMWGLWWTKRHWSRFSPSTSVSPANHSTDFSIIIITWGWHNRPLVAAVSSGPWFHPPLWKLKKNQGQFA
jgi:hypothetical protein